ncbi:MAG: hypothetical protein JST00_37410 [Deltaproteobacteria bacterium]|nr:hypothetical protein [Deltaproteobacteria bacterium]
MAIALLLSAACGADPEPDARPSVEPARIEGAPAEGIPVDGAAVTVEGVATATSTLSGAAAIATDRGLYRARTDGTFVRVPFHESSGADPRILGLTRRESGLLALTDRGLYHDAQGLLVRSPLSDALAPLGVTRVDVVRDVVWLATSRGPYRAKGGQLERVVVPAVEEAPDAVLGLRDDAVVVAYPSGVRLVDLAASTVRELGAFGRVVAFDRGGDGAVHLATERGLLSCTTDLVCSVRTFANAGEPARAVTGVTTAGGSLSVIVDDKLVTIDASGARIVARAPQGAISVAVDATGDAWFVAKGTAARAPLGSPPSFARDVVPFFDAHCLGCHAAGTNGAPKLELRDYAKASQLAPLVVRRLRAEGAPPMPPASVERLTPSDYAAVVRWAATGTKP